MNSHVPIEIQNKYPNIVFLGKPKIISNKKIIRAKNPYTHMSFYYSFEEDFFWLRECGVPEWRIN